MQLLPPNYPIAQWMAHRAHAASLRLEDDDPRSHPRSTAGSVRDADGSDHGLSAASSPPTELANMPPLGILHRHLPFNVAALWRHAKDGDKCRRTPSGCPTPTWSPLPMSDGWHECDGRASRVP